MKALNYSFMNPNGNRTLLADWPEGPFDACKMAKIGRLLLQQEPSAEQAGFVRGLDSAVPELYMAGGEFCGNASMAAAALFCDRRTSENGRVPLRLKLTVSGAEQPLALHVQPMQDSFFCREKMPPSCGFKTLTLPRGNRIIQVSAVIFPGITHLILPEKPDRSEAENLIRSWGALLKADALGLQFWDERAHTLTPLVYVPALSSLFWEGSCASGTAALGEWLIRQSCRDFSLTVREPAGQLQIDYSAAKGLFLSGTVIFEKKGILNYEIR